MRKIPTLFKRDESNMSRVTDQVHPECGWVMNGEGIPTVKIDGTSCLAIRTLDYRLMFYKRHRVKPGKVAPEGWFHWSFSHEATEGHGWVPIDAEDPADKKYLSAIDSAVVRLGAGRALSPGMMTMELIGEGVQGNPYNIKGNMFIAHGYECIADDLLLLPTPTAIKRWLEENEHEGIVWHHPDGRMAKIKRRDFGIPWPPKKGGGE